MSEERVEYGTYIDFLSDIKTRLKTARIRAHLSANRELLELYWDVGRMVAERQDCNGWSHNVLSMHIEQQDYERKGHAVTNFEHTLPAQEVLRWGRLSSLPKHQSNYRWEKPASQTKEAGWKACSTSRLEHASI